MSQHRKFATKSRPSLGSFRRIRTRRSSKARFRCFAVLSISVYGERPLREITEIADKRQAATGSVKDIGSIRLSAGSKREIEIWLDAEKLQAYHSPSTRYETPFERMNTETPGGRPSTRDRMNSCSDARSNRAGSRLQHHGRCHGCRERRSIFANVARVEDGREGAAQPRPAGWQASRVAAWSASNPAPTRWPSPNTIKDAQ